MKREISINLCLQLPLFLRILHPRFRHPATGVCSFRTLFPASIRAKRKRNNYLDIGFELDITPLSTI